VSHFGLGSPARARKTTAFGTSVVYRRTGFAQRGVIANIGEWSGWIPFMLAPAARDALRKLGQTPLHFLLTEIVGSDTLRS
jgi:hypothetical protein